MATAPRYLLKTGRKKMARSSKTERRKELTERRFAAALARGRIAWRKLIASEGGNICSAKAAELLRLSEPTVLRKYRTGQLLGWRKEGTNAVRLPRWQFERGKILPGLARVISVLNKAGYLDDKARVLFFLSEFGFVACRPLDLLREGRVTEARRAARSYTE